MKCDVCLKLLEEYLDSELAVHEAEQVSAHLITCAGCAQEFEGLAAEQETYARYDRGLEISPSLWPAIAAHTVVAGSVTDSSARGRLRARVAGLFAAPSLAWSLAGVVAVLLLAAMIGAAYLQTRRHGPAPGVTHLDHVPAPSAVQGQTVPGKASDSGATASSGADHQAKTKTALSALPRSNSRSLRSARLEQSDVLFPDEAYASIEEQETQQHIEQAQNLLRSVRNIEFDEDDTEVDVSYEKALSRKLLNENVVLRRDAEMSGKFPVKTLLSSLEPFLLDIANLPDKTSAADLRVIKERVQQTEIVAALHTY